MKSEDHPSNPLNEGASFGNKNSWGHDGHKASYYLPPIPLLNNSDSYLSAIIDMTLADVRVINNVLTIII